MSKRLALIAAVSLVLVIFAGVALAGITSAIVRTDTNQVRLTITENKADNFYSGWHTHPGPAIVTVVKGAVTYEDADANRCVDTTYAAGEGFVDRGFGHVHRAIAGDDGVDFYVVYLLPPGSTTHIIPASAPSECSS